MPIDFPTGPTTGQVYTYLGKSWVYNGTGWDVATPSFLPPFAAGNVIINGAFDIWQRGTSFTQANSYTADRWQQSTDKTATISRQAFTPGAAPVAGYEGGFFLRHTVNAGGSFQVVQQRIEDVRTFAGQTVTLSYWAKADVAVNNVVIIEQDFGSGGSAAVATSAVTHALTTSWARYTATFAVPSVAGKTIGTSSSLIVRVIRTIDALAHIVDLWGVQLEAGTVATPFRRNAPSIQAELSACQRYYYRRLAGSAYGKFGLGSTNNAGNSCLVIIPFPTTMRAVPSSTFEWTGTLANYHITRPQIASYTPTSFATDQFSQDNAALNVGISGAAAGVVALLEANNNANAFFGFSAEL
jgi:hypothetical protein